MSVSRIYRLLRLITLLQGSRGYSADELARELEVSRRTVFRDLNMLELAHIPYYHDPDTGGYRISRHFFLPPVSLTLTESLAILMMTGSHRARGAAAPMHLSGWLVENDYAPPSIDGPHSHQYGDNRRAL